MLPNFFRDSITFKHRCGTCFDNSAFFDNSFNNGSDNDEDSANDKNLHYPGIPRCVCLIFEFQLLSSTA